MLSIRVNGLEEWTKEISMIKFCISSISIFVNFVVLSYQACFPFAVVTEKKKSLNCVASQFCITTLKCLREVRLTEKDGSLQLMIWKDSRPSYSWRPAMGGKCMQEGWPGETGEREKEKQILKGWGRERADWIFITNLILRTSASGHQLKDLKTSGRGHFLNTIIGSSLHSPYVKH